MLYNVARKGGIHVAMLSEYGSDLPQFANIVVTFLNLSSDIAIFVNKEFRFDKVRYLENIVHPWEQKIALSKIWGPKVDDCVWLIFINFPVKANILSFLEWFEQNMPELIKIIDSSFRIICNDHNMHFTGHGHYNSNHGGSHNRESRLDAICE